jgi:hypothetical protein
VGFELLPGNYEACVFLGERVADLKSVEIVPNEGMESILRQGLTVFFSDEFNNLPLGYHVALGECLENHRCHIKLDFSSRVRCRPGSLGS